MNVITVSVGRQQDYHCYQDFLKCLAYHNYPPVVLTEGYFHLIDRPKMLYRYLKTTPNLPKHVCFCDSWDLLWLDSPKVALERFHDFGTSILFNAERNCFPHDDEVIKRMADAPYPSKYLNSGWMLGEVDAIVALLDHMQIMDIPEGTDMTEQGLFQKAFLEQPVPMKLDMRSEIAQCLIMEDERDFEITLFGLHNNNHDTNPIVAHANGCVKESVILRRLLEFWRSLL